VVIEGDAMLPQLVHWPGKIADEEPSWSWLPDATPADG